MPRKSLAGALCLLISLGLLLSALPGREPETFSPSLPAAAFSPAVPSSGEQTLDADSSVLPQSGTKPAATPQPGAIPIALQEDGGIVPVHSPSAAPDSPDPGRETAPVLETTLSGGAQVGSFFVKDSSGGAANLEEELGILPDLGGLLKRDGSPEILIYHTHTSEAYAQEDRDWYYPDEPTRSQNGDRGVVAVGEVMKAVLEAEGFGVIHDATVCDTVFNGSYARSWEVIERNLEEHPGIRITIDVHRDSMTTAEGVKYKPTVTIDGRKTAQVMLLAGSDPEGAIWGDFPLWQENLRLILRLQEKADALYPGLMRPMSFSDCKYNMNATPGSLLAEVGTEVNTVSQAKNAGRLLGKALAALLEEEFCQEGEDF